VSHRLGEPNRRIGRVSIEVDPRFAYDPERTVAEARTLWWLVDRPNLFVKIPAVKQGLPAISGCLAEGISINVTLIFSLARYAEVTEAFLTGLEGARAAGRDLSGIASVASFFVSRVDTEIGHRWYRSSCAAFSWLRSFVGAGFRFLRCPAGAAVEARRACPAFA
jgi:transaldolase